MKKTTIGSPLQFNMAATFLYLLSPTRYFRDGAKHICVKFFVIPMGKDKCMVDLATNSMTITISLSMKISSRFVG